MGHHTWRADDSLGMPSIFCLRQGFLTGLEFCNMRKLAGHWIARDPPVSSSHLIIPEAAGSGHDTKHVMWVSRSEPRSPRLWDTSQIPNKFFLVHIAIPLSLFLLVPPSFRHPLLHSDWVCPKAWLEAWCGFCHEQEEQVPRRGWRRLEEAVCV